MKIIDIRRITTQICKANVAKASNMRKIDLGVISQSTYRFVQKIPVQKYISTKNKQACVKIERGMSCMQH